MKEAILSDYPKDQDQQQQQQRQPGQQLTISPRELEWLKTPYMLKRMQTIIKLARVGLHCDICGMWLGGWTSYDPENDALAAAEKKQRLGYVFVCEECVARYDNATQGAATPQPPTTAAGYRD